MRARTGVLIALALTVPSLTFSASHAKAPRYKLEYHTCTGRAPIDTGCTIKTRLRGALMDREPWIFLGIYCGDPHDPVYQQVPWYTYYGTIRVSVVGQRRGYEKLNATCINGSMRVYFDPHLTWGRYDNITMTVTTAGAWPGTPIPPFGPWIVQLGIPVPIK